MAFSWRKRLLLPHHTIAVTHPTAPNAAPFAALFASALSKERICESRTLPRAVRMVKHLAAADNTDRHQQP
eukprot:1640485-Rhodomonas_salina.4